MGIANAIKSAALRSVAAIDGITVGATVRVPLPGIRRFLLLQHATALGSVVHATPLVSALRQAVPGCEIVVAASGLANEIFRFNPGVNAVIETPSPLRDLTASVFALRRLNPLRGGAFATLTTTGNERTRVAMQAVLAEAGNRVGFTVSPELYRQSLRYDRARSQIANNLRIVEALGHELRPDSESFEPCVFFSKANLAKAEALLAEANAKSLPILAIVTQTSGGQRTGWHRERFVEVIRHATEELHCAVMYVGTGAEAAAVERLRAATGGLGVSLAGKTSPTELAAVLALSDYAVSLDTGTMHVGRAVGVPMVVLGPSWQRPTEWMPLGIPHIRILRGKDREEVPPGYQLDEIEAAEVNAALDILFRQYPASQQQRDARVKRSLANTNRC